MHQLKLLAEGFTFSPVNIISNERTVPGAEPAGAVMVSVELVCPSANFTDSGMVTPLSALTTLIAYSAAIVELLLMTVSLASAVPEAPI